MNQQNISNANDQIRGSFGFGNPGGMQMPMQISVNHNQQQPHLSSLTQPQISVNHNPQQPHLLTQTQPQLYASHNPQQPHLLSQTQLQSRQYFPGHFQPTEPQVQGSVQGQTTHTQTPKQVLAQPQGRNHVSLSGPPVSSPVSGGAGTGKRLQKPPSRLSGGSPTQGTASPMKTMELTPAARREKRKLPDKVIPDKIAAMLPESSLYTQLVEFESRVDAALARKKVDILESLKNPVCAQKTLRIYVFNTYANQTLLNAEETAEPPSWTLKLTGRILENGKDPALEGPMQRLRSSFPKFSSFFKKITIYLNQNLYPDNHVIHWESSRSSSFHEGFEVKRKGDKEFTAIIRLEMNNMPEKFKLSPALHDVLQIDVDTRPRIMAALWHYVKTRKLQIQGDASSFMCDPPLRKVFGEEKLKFSLVSQKITQHLLPPGSIHLEHKVKLSGVSPIGNTCYDVLVDIPWALEKEMSTFLTNMDKNTEIEDCDNAISSALKGIHEHRRRRAFFLGFSQSPAEFINSLIASQARDLKLAAADANRDVEKERRAEFYNQQWIEDAVLRYLNRRAAVGSEVTGNK